MTVRGPMVRIALLEDTDRFGQRPYIQVLLPIDFTFGKGGTVMGWEIGLQEGRFRLVQWMPQSNI